MKKLLHRLKHLRGRHNQLDHAWNRGMGRGGGSLVNNQMGPVSTEDFYKKRARELENQVRSGQITRAQSRAELAQLRGQTQNTTAQPKPSQLASGNPKVSQKVAEYLSQSDDIGREVVAAINEILFRPPRAWTIKDKKEIAYAIWKYKQSFLHEPDFDTIDDTEIDNFFKHVLPSFSTGGDEPWNVDTWEILGLTPDEIVYFTKQLFKTQPTLTNVIALKMQEIFHKRAVAVSKMSDEEQNDAYNALMERIKPFLKMDTHGLENNLDTQEKRDQVISDCEAVMALALYGNPELRMRAIEFMSSTPIFTVERRVVIPKQKRAPLTRPIQALNRVINTSSSIAPVSSVRTAAQYYSLEYRLLLAKQKQFITEKNTDLVKFLAGTSFDINGLTELEWFMVNFFYTHTSQNTSNILGAAIQQAMSQVGPNRNVPNIPSLYPSGVTPPRSHPKIIQYLQQWYEQTQLELPINFPPHGPILYRGVKEFTSNGIPMAPWSPDVRISGNFATSDERDQLGTLNNGEMPFKYIFAYWNHPLFITEFTAEKEFLILETAAFENSDVDIYDAASGDTYDLAEWKFKQFLARNKNIFDEANSVVDYSIISPYESQYDIFYNFRKKKNKLKEVRATLKHLRGRHNQLDHAWNRGMGRGGSVALVPNQIGPVPTREFYQKRARELEQQVRSGQITRAQSRAELAQLRGQTQDSTTQPKPLRSASGNPKVSQKVAEYLSQSDDIGKETVDTIQEFLTRKPRKWTVDEKRELVYLLWSKRTLSLMGIYGEDDFNRLTNTEIEYVFAMHVGRKGVNWKTYIWEDLGITFDEIKFFAENGIDPDLENIIALKVQQIYHKRAVAVSKMSDEEQNAVYDALIQRLSKYGNNVDQMQLSDQENDQLASDCEAVMSLALYGNPELRMRAIQQISSNDVFKIQRKYHFPGDSNDPSTRRSARSIVGDRDVNSIRDVAQYYSLEHRLNLAHQHIVIPTNDEYGKPLPKNHLAFEILSGPSKTIDSYNANLLTMPIFDLFMLNFFYTHTSQNTSNILGAAIQQAMSQVGPNAQIPNIPSLYPPGVTPPRPHPEIVRYLQAWYEKTQQELQRSEIELYSGGSSFSNTGIPMGPWSESKFTAQRFAYGTRTTNGALNHGFVPRKYIFAHYMQPFFLSHFGEREFLVLETAALQNGTYTEDTSQTLSSGVENYDWTIKQLKNAFANMFSQASGDIDYTPMSLYEPQYDIFYNFRKKKNKLKEVRATLKHLRGRHNQLDHAWNRGMGRGGSVALAPNQMGPAVSEDFYRKRARELENQVRSGQITRAQSRAELAQLRGQTQDSTTQPKPLRSASGNSKVSQKVAEYLSQSDDIGKETVDTIQEFLTRKPRKWTVDEKRELVYLLWSKNMLSGIGIPTIDEFNKLTNEEIEDLFLVHVGRRGRVWHTLEWEDLGITFDEIKFFAETGIGPSIANIIALKVQQIYHKRAVAVSKMSDEEQNAVYDALMQRLSKYGNNDVQLQVSMEENNQLASDCEAVMSFALYGNPELRMRAIQQISSNDVFKIQREYYANPNNQSNQQIAYSIPGESNIKSIRNTAQYYSLEHRLNLAHQHIVTPTDDQYGKPQPWNLLAFNIISGSRNTIDSYNANLPTMPIFDLFMLNFFYTHTSQNTSNILGAAIQQAMSQVGPNAQIPNIPSLYPPGVTPPRPHPEIVRYLQAWYEKTQQELQRSEIELYSGGSSFSDIGIPMGPWSESEFTAQRFARRTRTTNGALNHGFVPRKYIFAHYMQPFFLSNFGEQEFLVLETAALQNGTYTEDTSQTLSSGVEKYDWTIKQLKNAFANMFSQASGDIDYTPMSLYEPQYDIFYNFRKKKNKLKEVRKNIKSLRNKYGTTNNSSSRGISYNDIQVFIKK